MFELPNAAPAARGWERTPDMVLYHYCSPAAFKSIISNKELWMFSARSMRDRHEVVHYLSMISNVLANTIPEKKPLVRQIKSRFEQLATFITCFATGADSEHHWKEYTNGGDGVAIGFNWRHFCSSYGVPKPWMRGDKEHFIAAHPVVYRSSSQEFRAAFGVVSLMESNDEETFVTDLLCDAMLSKEPHFEPEDEVRLVKAYWDRDDVRDLGFIESNGQRRHYVRYAFPRPNAECKPIRTVTIGPNCSMSSREVLEVLHENGFGDIDHVAYSRDVPEERYQREARLYGTPRE
jgi:Protein of unknown function (DUF2971)